jgi:hypothetical protein
MQYNLRKTFFSLVAIALKSKWLMKGSWKSAGLFEGIYSRSSIGIVGFYKELEFMLYISALSNKLWIPVRFLSCTAVCLSGLIALGYFRAI